MLHSTLSYPQKSSSRGLRELEYAEKLELARSFSANNTTVDAYQKEPFLYRGKIFDTTTALDKSILKERDMKKKVNQ